MRTSKGKLLVAVLVLAALGVAGVRLYVWRGRTAAKYVLKKQLGELQAKGIRLIDEKPRMGAGGAKIAFLHPKATNGVLVELCQRD